MTMTNEEIVRDYCQAKDKKEQIKILADLNMASTSEIKAVLAKAGVEGVEAPKRIRRKTEIPPRPAEATKTAEASVYDRIEAILDAVPHDASDRICECALDMATALLQEYVVQRMRNERHHKGDKQ